MKDNISCFSIPVQPKCLLRCGFCPNSDEFQSNTPTPSLNEIFEYIKFAESWNIKELCLYTEIGEVLLCSPDKLETILDYCEKSDIIEDVYIFTSLTKINKKTLEVGLDEKFKKVSAIVSIYGVDKISIQERTNIDCFDDLVEHMNILKNHNKEIFYLNRTVHSKLSGNKNMHNIFNDSMCDEDLSKDSSYNTKEYTKDKNLISDRNGACKYSGKGDCGFNSNGYLVQCGWIVTDKIVGHISEGLEVLDKKLNSIIREQKMNIFDKKCSNCGAYEPYEND